VLPDCLSSPKSFQAGSTSLRLVQALKRRNILAGNNCISTGAQTMHGKHHNEWRWAVLELASARQALAAGKLGALFLGGVIKHASTKNVGMKSAGDDCRHVPETLGNLVLANPGVLVGLAKRLGWLAPCQLRVCWYHVAVAFPSSPAIQLLTPSALVASPRLSLSPSRFLPCAVRCSQSF
jgi:hypothetical protein